MTTSTITTADAYRAERVALIAVRSTACDERAKENARRQAVIDHAGESGRELTDVEQAMLDDATTRIRRFDAEITRLDKRIDARRRAAQLIDAADQT